MTEVTVRVYGPLNDFLPTHRRQLSWRRLINGHTSVKDLIESLGVPHPEIDLILVNGMSGCGHVYWKGSHWKRLKQAIDAARGESERSAIGGPSVQTRHTQ